MPKAVTALDAVVQAEEFERPEISDNQFSIPDFKCRGSDWEFEIENW